MLNILKNQKGVSLMELTVSVGIFSVIVIMATSIFQNISKGQQVAISSQNTQEAIRYTFEVMSKEIRFARTSNTSTGDECRLAGATLPINRVFNKDTVTANKFSINGGSEYLYFKNKNGECVYYYLHNSALMVYRINNATAQEYEATTTPSSIVVSDFGFFIYDRSADMMDRKQAYVTFYIKAHAKGREELSNETILQTTISSRMYE